MKQSKIIIFTLIALAAIFAVTFTGCSRQKEKKEAELRYGFTSEPKTLDPLSANNTADGRSILFNVFEGLIKPDTDGTFLPCAAQAWTIDRDSLTYTFTLRENVRFHDGSIVTPKDVKFSFDKAIEEGYHGLNMIKDVIIQGENQIIIILHNADPDYLPYLTIGIVKDGNDNREKDVIGTGPFFIESYLPQRNLVLKRFDNYWQRFLPEPREIPYLEKVTIVFFANNDALITSLRGGSIDGAWLTGSQIEQLNKNDFDIIHNFSSSIQLLALNNASPPLDDIRVRKAINYGIDIQQIIDAAFFGRGFHSGSPVIPGLSAYYEESLGYPYEPQTAVSLLNEAGFNSGRNFSLEITVPSNYVMHIDTAQVIVSQLMKIGIDASIKLVDWTTWISDVYRGRNYQATIISLDSPVVSPRSFLSRYSSKESNNFINFNNNDYDKIYQALLTETDTAKRDFLYREAQRTITSNAASVYIQDILYYNALRKDTFTGVENYPLYVIDFSLMHRVDKN